MYHNHRHVRKEEVLFKKPNRKPAKTFFGKHDKEKAWRIQNPQGYSKAREVG